MKQSKLKKTSRPSSHVAVHAPKVSAEFPFRTSIDELRDSTNRSTLRQHFSGAFPEAQAQSTIDSRQYPVSHSKRGSTRRRAATLQASRSQDSSEGLVSAVSTWNNADIKRLSTVPEAQGRVDITEAIRMLEELRATASPAELVALHKALLPTRDSILLSPGLPPTAEELLPPSETPPFVRRRSMLPPAIATRKPARYLLNQLNEPTTRIDNIRPSLKPILQGGRPTPSLTRTASEPALSRAATPALEGAVCMGGYRPGTLRVTNGRASPDSIVALPSVAVMTESAPDAERHRKMPSGGIAFHQPLQGAEVDIGPTESGSKTDGTIPSSGDLVVSPGPGLIEVQFDTRQPHVSQMSRLSEPIPSTTASATALKHLPGDEEPALQRRDSSNPALAAVGIDKQNNIAAAPVGLETSGSLDKSDMPRFAQRWSHRLSHIGFEATSGQEVETLHGITDPKCSYDVSSCTPDALMHDLAHLTEATVSPGTPDVALARLNGQVQHVLQSRATGFSHSSKGSSSDSSVLSGQSLQGDQAPHDKSDSGYASNVSSLSTIHDRTRMTQTISQHRSRSDGPSSAHKAYAGLSLQKENISVYSVQQMLQSPALLSGLATPSSPDDRGSTKHLSVLGLDEAPVGKLSQERKNSATLVQSSLPTTDASKPRNKLHKQRPFSSIRSSLRLVSGSKADKRKTRNLASWPDLTDDLEDMFPQATGPQFSRHAPDDIPEQPLLATTAPVSGVNRSIRDHADIPQLAATHLVPTTTAKVLRAREVSISGVPQGSIRRLSRPDMSPQSGHKSATSDKPSNGVGPFHLAEAPIASPDGPTHTTRATKPIVYQCRTSEVPPSRNAVEQSFDHVDPLKLPVTSSKSQRPMQQQNHNTWYRRQDTRRMDSILSTRHSERPGDATESIADAVKQAAQARGVQEVKSSRRSSEHETSARHGASRPRAKDIEKNRRSPRSDQPDLSTNELLPATVYTRPSPN